MYSSKETPLKTITDLTPTPENQEIIYNSLDTMQTMALKEIFDGGLLPDWSATGYRYSELMLGPIMTMMRRGVQIDTAKRDTLVAALQVRAARVQEQFDHLWRIAVGHDHQPQLDAPTDLSFYTLLAIPEQTKSKKGETKSRHRPAKSSNALPVTTRAVRSSPTTSSASATSKSRSNFYPRSCHRRTAFMLRSISRARRRSDFHQCEHPFRHREQPSEHSEGSGAHASLLTPDTFAILFRSTGRRGAYCCILIRRRRTTSQPWKEVTLYNGRFHGLWLPA